MNDDDKIFDAFRRAAQTGPSEAFPGSERVWQRVDGRLDRRALRSGMARWKKLAIAACLLLVGTLGYVLSRDNEIQPVVVDDADKPQIAPQTLPMPAVEPEAMPVIGPVTVPVIVPEPERAVAATSDVLPDQTDFKTESTSDAAIQADELPPVQVPIPRPEPEAVAMDEPRSQVEMTVAAPKKAAAVKDEPLLIVDGKAVAGKDYRNRKTVQADEQTETVHLKEPLYIINGVEYTEQEMFGPNPTSPYAPLNKQEIEEVKVLQGQEAISVYGEKGRKGVLIIRTKNGKPLLAKKATSK